MNIIPMENKELDKFEPEQQRLIRTALGHSDAWCGMVESAKWMTSIYNSCGRQVDTALQLILREFPTELATYPTVVLCKDDYLDSFIFKSRHGQKGLDVALIIAVHRVYTNLNITDRTADYLRATGIKLVSASEYLRLKKSMLDMENMLASVVNVWPPYDDKRYADRVKGIVDQAASGLEPRFTDLLNNMVTLENRINALKEASVQVEQRLKEIDPANTREAIEAVRGFTQRLAELDSERSGKFVVSDIESALTPGTGLFNELLKNLGEFLREDKDFRDSIAKAIGMHVEGLKVGKDHAD